MIENHESITAKLCSFVRAHHSMNENNKIFDDYLAFDLMGVDEYRHIRSLIESGKCGMCEKCHSKCLGKDRLTQTVHLLAPIPLSREAYTLDIFRSFVQKYPRCQYVICGAGMDSFLFRNDNPNITIFEVDHPDTQKYKQHRISELGWIVQKNISFVPVDFSKDDLATKLLESGFDPNLPTFFTILGVTYYLSLQSFEKTIERMDSISACGSVVVLDYPDRMSSGVDVPERVRRLEKMTARFGERMTQGFSLEDMHAVFERHHYSIAEHLSPDIIQNYYFRNRNDGMTAYENIHFIHAQKTKAFYAYNSIFTI